jgi:alpha-tubulin suppressor-like RCC1 family protein
VNVDSLSGPAVSISTGQAPCVATGGGSVECWGMIAEDALTPVPVTAIDGGTSIAAGGNLSTGEFACAVSGLRPMACWGGNTYGQLGDGTTTSSAIPVDNATLTTETLAVASGTDGNFACGIASGLAYCWGDNSSGQLGDGTMTSSPLPVSVQGLSGVIAIAAGANHACAITSADADAGDGTLYCWGDNTYGELGTESTVPSLVPVAVPELGSGVSAISLGLYASCALLSNGTVDCWGYNPNGQLGNGTTNTTLTPTPVVGVMSASAIALGWFSACAIANEAIECWGDNEAGELGDNSFTSSLVPVSVMGPGSGATQVAVGRDAACAVVGGGARCWGEGPTGDGDAPGIVNGTPYLVTGLGTGVTAVAVAVDFACAIADGGVQCWGLNTAGELGNGGAVDAFLPIAIPGFP